jgi:hypothetical protein
MTKLIVPEWPLPEAWLPAVQPVSAGEPGRVGVFEPRRALWR